ncbi:MAG: hypothetical protein AAGD25_06345 [Cyanobacteria bacterium P01_F01_bin.150]
MMILPEKKTRFITMRNGHKMMTPSYHFVDRLFLLQRNKFEWCFAMLLPGDRVACAFRPLIRNEDLRMGLMLGLIASQKPWTIPLPASTRNYWMQVVDELELDVSSSDIADRHRDDLIAQIKATHERDKQLTQESLFTSIATLRTSGGKA